MTTRPSGRVVSVGYQRPWRMVGCTVQVSVNGLKVRISLRPFQPTEVGVAAYSRLPPATTTRPSGSVVMPLHQMLYGWPVAGLMGGSTSLVVPVAGSHR